VTRKKKISIVAAAAALAIGTVFVVRHYRAIDVKTLVGTVLTDDSDPRKQTPIAGAEISVDNDQAVAPARSDASGAFHINLRPGVSPGDTLILRFRHPGFEPLNIYENAGDQIYVVRMEPVPHPAPGQDVTVSNVRVRYAMTSTRTVHIGSAVKTFEVVNVADVPCDGHAPCSPDHKWKATISGASLDAGEGNEFEDARLSCLAGPCAFTKVEVDSFSKGGRTISASVRNWSDTASFLLEGEVTRTMDSDMVRQSFPVIYGSGMDFTLPVGAAGLSLEAEVDGAEIVYPLGPSLATSWAACTVKPDSGKSTLYHCDLKSGYRFATP
jgi:hypothetical protein